MKLFYLMLFSAFVVMAQSGVAAETAAPLKVVLLSGCPTYHSEELLPPFQKFLEENYNVRCQRLVRSADDNLPGLEALDDCDVAFVFFKRMKLKGEQLERFKKYVTSGRPLVGVRTASHAVQTWLDFDREVLGGNYHNHYSNGPVTQIQVVEGAERHPVLAGVELKSAPESLYKNSGHASDINILLKGTIPNEPTEAIAWTRVHNGGRVFYTSLGGAESFDNPAYRKMLVNALFWTAKREVEAKAKS